MRDWKWIGLIGLLGLGVHSELQRFERDAARDIASKLEGPRKKVRIRTVSDGPLGILSNRIRRGTIEASGFQTPGLPLFVDPTLSQSGHLGELVLKLSSFRLGRLDIDKLEAVIPNCRFDAKLALRKHIVRLSRSGEGFGSVEILSDALGRYVETRFREIQHAKVTLQGGVIEISGRAEFLITRSNFDLIGTLTITGPRELSVKPTSLMIDGVSASIESADALLKAINPVVELDRDLGLAGAIDLKSVEILEGRLVGRGVVRIPLAKS